MQLVTLAIKKSSSQINFFEHLSGQDKDISDYLYHTVFVQQSPQVQKFLLYSAVSNRLCAELCQKLTRQSGSQVLLEKLERDNLFLIALDRKQKWFRYHHLFQEFLLAELKKREPQKIKKLFFEVSKWHEVEGRSDEALQYALQAKDYERASKLLSQIAWESSHVIGDYYSLIHWVEEIPQKHRKAYPIIDLCYTLSLIMTGQLKKSQQAFKTFKTLRGIDKKRPLKWSPLLSVKMQWLEIALRSWTDQLEHLEEKIQSCLREKAIEQWDPSLLAGITCAYGYFLYATRQFKKSQSTFKDLVDQAWEINSINGVLWCSLGLVLSKIELGHIQEAKKILSDLQEDPKAQQKIPAAYMPMLHLFHFYIQVQQGDLKASNIKEVQLSPNDVTYMGFVFLAYQSQTWRNALENNPKSLFSEINSGIKLFKKEGFPRFLFLLQVEKVFWHLRLGQVQEAEAFLSETQLLKSDLDLLEKFFHPQFHELSFILKTRLLLAKGQGGSVDLRELEKFLQKAKNQVRKRPSIQLLLLKAITLYQKQRAQEALQVLNLALETCAPQNWTLPFWEEATLIRPLLEASYQQQVQEPHSKIPLQYLNRLRDSFKELPWQKDIPIKDVFIAKQFESLSKRELEILRILESSLSHSDLAKKLFISVTTLRFHLRNIYRKLDVKNRSGAVARAKQLGVLTE